MDRDPQQIAIEQPRERQPRRLARAQALLLEPERALTDAGHQEKDDNRRSHAGPQHQPPRPVGVVAHQRITELIHERRQQEPRRVAALQDARGDAAMFGRPLLERERHARGPHAAHADAEEPAEREQHHVARRQPAQEREARIPGNREKDRPLTAVPIGERAGADAADHAKEQRDRRQRSGEREVDLEAAPNVREDEGDDGEVECVERPGGERGQERFPFLTGNLFVPRHWQDSSREPPLDGARGALSLSKGGNGTADERVIA